MEQSLTCETSDSAVYCLTSALVGGVERSVSDQGPSRLPSALLFNKHSKVVNGRRRTDQPREDGADGAVHEDDVQTQSRIIHRSCGFMISRPRYWFRPDSARAEWVRCHDAFACRGIQSAKRSPECMQASIIEYKKSMPSPPAQHNLDEGEAGAVSHSERRDFEIPSWCRLPLNKSHTYLACCSNQSSWSGVFCLSH